MIRTVVILTLIVTAGLFSHQKFGAFSVHDAALQSPELMRYVNLPSTDEMSGPRLLKAKFSDDEENASVWDTWIDTLQHGVPLRSAVWTSSGASHNLANITNEAVTVLIQSELHRIGCYHGRINAKWDEGTSKALKSFAKWSKTSQQTFSPNLSTLTILRHAAVKTCPVPCKTGFIQTSTRGQCQQVAKLQLRSLYDPMSDFSPEDAAFLPDRNPQRELGQTIIEAEVPLPTRNYRNQQTAGL